VREHRSDQAPLIIQGLGLEMGGEGASTQQATHASIYYLLLITLMSTSFPQGAKRIGYSWH